MNSACPIERVHGEHDAMCRFNVQIQCAVNAIILKGMILNGNK